MSLELLLKQSQLLLLRENILAIEGHLLPLAIRLLMLFLHLLSHLVKHLKELVFTLLGQSKVDDWFLWQRGAGVLGDKQSVISKPGDRVPSGAAALLLIMATL